MQERVLYFHRETQNLKFNLYTMPRHQRANAPHPAAVASPVIALDTFLHVCLWSGAATAPSEIEVPAASHFGGCNHCDADLCITIIECVGCNVRWFSDVCHRNNNNNNGDSFKYSIEWSGHTQLVDVSSRGLLKQISRFRE